MSTETALDASESRVRIPAGDQRFFQASDFYARESELLDDGLLERWLDEALAEQVEYLVPVRATQLLSQESEFVGRMYHLDENRASLTSRIQRLATQVAWAEDPPSRARRHLSSLQAYEGDDGSLRARMNVLLTRNRLDRPTYELLSYERRDWLVDDGNGYRLRRRVALVDQSCLGMVNLAIFL